jgi:hypothetical protein
MRRLCGTPKLVAPEVEYASRDFKKYCYSAEKADIYALGRCLEIVV